MYYAYDGTEFDNENDMLTYNAQLEASLNGDLSTVGMDVKTDDTSINTGYKYTGTEVGWDDGTVPNTYGGLTPAGSVSLNASYPSNGVVGPVNTYQTPTGTGATPNGWGFLGDLASSTMTTIGQALGTRLNNEIVGVTNQINPKPAAPKPATSSGGGSMTLILLALGVAVVAGGSFAATRGRRTARA